MDGWLVHKFGGSSVADAACMTRVAAILEADPAPCLAVVLSAARGVTDALLQVSAFMFLVSVLWGVAFIPQRVAMQHLQPLSFSGFRFLVGKSYPGAVASCVPSATRLCLGDWRFQVEIAWRDFNMHLLHDFPDLAWQPMQAFMSIAMPQARCLV